MRDAPIEAVGVGIPARDEERSIEACLTSIAVAALGLDVPVAVAVAADRCEDGTIERATAALHALAGPSFSGVVLAVDHGRAGAARAAALDRALGHLVATGRPLERCWLATTDADTTVSADWLRRQLRWARDGVDGVAGLVDVAWDVDDQALAKRFHRSLEPGGTGDGHGHVHGANLGLRADRWVEVDGCGPQATGEDHELWRRLRLVGADVRGVADVRVRTSARVVARAPDGFASYLRALA